jgi:PAP2 superfamily
MNLGSTVYGSAKHLRFWQRLEVGSEAAFASGEACLQWLLLFVVAAVDWAWMGFAGFHIGAGLAREAGLITLLVAIGQFYAGRDQRLMDFAHSGARCISLFAVLMPLSYLSVSTNAPLVDSTFDAIDKAMGLHWIAWTEWVIAHPASRWWLQIAYASLPIQMLFCYWHNTRTRAGWKNSEIWWLTFISALITIMVGALVPGISAWVYYGRASMHDFLHMQQFEALRAGTLHVISFNDAQGLVQLPSFHTILAIILTYNLRHDRRLLLLASVLNAVLILSCPTEGGHYFVDIAAGAAAAAATIGGVRALRRRLEPTLSRRIDVVVCE